MSDLDLLLPPIMKNIAYTLSFTVLVTSCMINPNFQISGPRSEQAPSRGGLPSSLFRKITQQYILPLEYSFWLLSALNSICLPPFVLFSL